MKDAGVDRSNRSLDPMLIEIVAVAAIVALVGAQAGVLTRKKRLEVASGAVRPLAPAVAFRDDPQGWLVDALRRRRWVRRSLSLGSLGAFLFAVGMLGYPFYTNLVQSEMQRLEQKLTRLMKGEEVEADTVANRAA